MALLARLVAQIERPIMPDERFSLTAWSLGREGRKHHSASAMHDEAGELVALAKALWIEVKEVPA